MQGHESSSVSEWGRLTAVTMLRLRLLFMPTLRRWRPTPVMFSLMGIGTLWAAAIYGNEVTMHALLLPAPIGMDRAITAAATIPGTGDAAVKPTYKAKTFCVYFRLTAKSASSERVLTVAGL